MFRSFLRYGSTRQAFKGRPDSLQVSNRAVAFSRPESGVTLITTRIISMVISILIGVGIIHTTVIAAPSFNGINEAHATVDGFTLILGWDPATNSSGSVNYNIFASTISMGQDFSKPNWTTNQTDIYISWDHGLRPFVEYYFIVRAWDSTGEDNNTIERSISGVGYKPLPSPFLNLTFIFSLVGLVTAIVGSMLLRYTKRKRSFPRSSHQPGTSREKLV